MARQYKEQLEGDFKTFFETEIKPLSDALTKDIEKFIRTKGKASGKRIRQTTSELARKFKILRQHTWNEQGNKEE